MHLRRSLSHAATWVRGPLPASCAVRQGSRLPYYYLGARAAGPHPALCGREVVCCTITWVRGPLARILRCAAGKSFAVPLPGCAGRWPASCAVRQGSRLPYQQAIGSRCQPCLMLPFTSAGRQKWMWQPRAVAARPLPVPQGERKGVRGKVRDPNTLIDKECMR